MEVTTDKPRVLDPYFNATYQCNGEGPLLSADEMIRCGDGVTWTLGPYQQYQRTIETANFHHYLYRTLTF